MHRLRKRIHVSPATLIATLALVFAMTGGAYAANKFLITSTKQISPKVLKSLKGASGAKGANGANGANGAAGPAGPTGATGAAGTGTPGATGNEGKAGVSPEGAEFKAPTNKGTCTAKQGGVEFKGANTTYACNGKEGSPWTAGGTLPHGSSETGVWSLNQSPEGAVVFIPISFPIPLAASLDAKHVHLINFTQSPPEGCLGSEAKPEAEPGNLCIWGSVALGPGAKFSDFETTNIENLKEGESKGAGKNGTVLKFVLPQSGYGLGEWVVSGP